MEKTHTHTYMYWSYQCMMGEGVERVGKRGRGCILTISKYMEGKKLKLKHKCGQLIYFQFSSALLVHIYSTKSLYSGYN